MRLDIVSKHRSSIYGLAILWVVIFHGTAIDKVDYTFGHQHLLGWLQSIISVGNVGVDVFLLLSGVCLYFSFCKKQDAYGFMKKRIARIVPPGFNYLRSLLVSLLYREGPNSWIHWPCHAASVLVYRRSNYMVRVSNRYSLCCLSLYFLVPVFQGKFECSYNRAACGYISCGCCD